MKLQFLLSVLRYFKCASTVVVSTYLQTQEDVSMTAMQRLETTKKKNQVFAAGLTNDKGLPVLLREGN